MKIGTEYYFYHNDHLGTPQKMMAVNGAVVWSAKYSSFGKAEVHPTSTVENNLRFPGQYYDAETGLHYNYHRYYDPDTGRYLTPDPIGLAGGINPFVYTVNNPINSIDPWGLFSLNDAINSLRENKVKGENGIYMYSHTQVFDEWLRLERNDTKWLDELPACPKKINPCENPDDNTWNNPGDANSEHKGATYQMRSRPTPGGHASQCSYDSNGNLMTGIPAGGTADRGAWARGTRWRHYTDDYKPWILAEQLNRRQDYYDVRPIR
ncbi:MAG: hypothetical protein GY857_01205 [Desulfobacula sp.]|nr:hypothetical protein [Desulfobacula sp.]